ncbi:MAG: SRPBCC family protein [Candidatus Omnitrophota bacterium]
MPDNENVRISVSRVIPAPKWKVVRHLTKVWEFPSFVPSVKSVSVIHKSAHKLKTEWHVEVNNIPIHWVEEDVLELKKNAIYFKAIEGDLEEFKGEWLFSEDQAGTKVTANIEVRVGIPAIKEFADAYIKKVVTLIFEEILMSLERRLVSRRYSNYKQGDTSKLAGFGILGHFYNLNHLTKCLKMIKPDFKAPSKEFLEKLFTMTPSFKMFDMKEYKSKTGETTNGCFIVCTFIPDMLYTDVHTVYSKVVRACKLAEKAGVGIVTLGGFTSMVGERLGHQITDEVDIPITTGNTYTAFLAVEGVLKAVRLLEKDPKNLSVTIIGGTGDIGSACARILVENVKNLTLTGRTKSNLRRLHAELKKRRGAKVDITTDNKKAVSNADIIIAAANSSAAILEINWFKPGAVICDLGYPKNISYAPTERRDILVFSGGLSSVPTPIHIGIDMGLPSPDVVYGCFSEVIILALERRFENFSYGRGNITKEKMEEIGRLAQKHGFELAPFFWADWMITDEDIERIKKVTSNQ